MQGRHEMNNNHSEIENQKKLEAAQNNDAVGGTDRLRNEAYSSGRANQEMTSMQANGQAAQLLESTKFSIDFGAVVRSVDENGYVSGSVRNSLRSQVGSHADSVIADAQMSHATTAFKDSEQGKPNNESIHATATTTHSKAA
jgi:hypothetical protein